MTKLGMTGNQNGLSDEQSEVFIKILQKFYITEFHHGDCLGADFECANLVRDYCPKTKISGHPPKNQTKRAFFPCDFEYAQKDYLVRNKHIVNSTTRLIAFPDGPEKLRSGTWSTVRFARKKNIPVLVVMPDGRLEYDLYGLGCPVD